MPSSQSADHALALCSRDPTKVLGLNISNHNVTPGQFIPRKDAQATPELSFNVPSPTATYMLINIDIDAPYPSFAVISPILHWIQPGLKASTAEDGSFVLKATASVIASHLGPAPPPVSAPHRYIFILYEQPEGFDVSKYAPAEGKELGMWGRIRFDLDGFEKENGLGPLVASNYLLSN